MSPSLTDVRRIGTSDEEISEISALLRRVWPREPKFEPRYLTWLYRENPVGPVVGYNAYIGGAFAAHYATVPLDARIGAHSSRGLLSLNTATHPEHQGKGLFTLLAQATFAAAAAEGFEFVVGIANANSTPGFVKKLGFQLVAPLDVQVGFGPLPTEAAGAVAFRRLWSPESLRWRLGAPGARYFRRATAGGSTIESVTAWPWIHASLACFTDDALVAVAADLPGASLLAPRVWLGLMGPVRWPRTYQPLPDRLKPSPLNLIFRPLARHRAAPDRSEVRFQALDFDAY